MITSYQSFRLLYIATFLALGAFFQSSATFAAEKDSRIRSRQPVPASQRQASPPNRLRSSTPPQSLAESPQSRRFDPPVRQLAELTASEERLIFSDVESVDVESVEQTGFVRPHLDNCGPVCDCGECGYEESYSIDQPRGFFDMGCGIESIFSRCQGCNQGCSECDGVMYQPGEMYFEDTGCGMEILGDCGCDACNPCDTQPTLLPRIRFNWCRYEFFAGVQGYTGPLNHVGINTGNGVLRSGSGSFGFYEGFNRGKSLNRLLGLELASQFGVRGTQSNLSGAAFTTETRHQVFVTGGLFRRVDYGVQYGLVLDYMNQDWYFQGDSLQLRGELSWRTRDCNTFGFQFMAGLREETTSASITDEMGTTLTSDIDIKPTDQYRFFFRRPLSKHSEYNLMAGWTDNKDGLLGAGFNVPLNQRCSLSSGVTYLIPYEGKNRGGHEEENWNISLGLVYRPGGPQGCGRYCGPMFDVADNGTFMLDVQ